MKRIAQITDTDFGMQNHISKKKPKYSSRAILVNNNKIAVVHEKMTNLFSLPGGSLEDEETPEECILRELKEETGNICHIEYPLGYIFENRGLLNYTKYSYFFVTSILSVGSPSLTPAELELQQEIIWLPLNKTYQTIANQKCETMQYKFIQKRDLLALNFFQCNNLTKHTNCLVQ